MRPIVKKNIDETIELFEYIEDIPTQPHVIQEDYLHYGEARKVLLANLGNYCSYCECYFENGAILQTEHVQPKGFEVNGIKPYANLKTKWSNFLLACATCNGSGNKGQKNVVLDEIHLPHRNNTFLSFEYREAGVVVVNPQLQGISRQHAESLLSLVGLNKGDSETDMRCDVRRKTWDKAVQCRQIYIRKETSLENLMNVIRTSSCWSIWYTVFQGIDEVRKAMLDFPGTEKACFDPNNHFNPVNRNPQNVVDPV